MTGRPVTLRLVRQACKRAIEQGSSSLMTVEGLSAHLHGLPVGQEAVPLVAHAPCAQPRQPLELWQLPGHVQQLHCAACAPQHLRDTWGSWSTEIAMQPWNAGAGCSLSDLEEHQSKCLRQRKSSRQRTSATTASSSMGLKVHVEYTRRPPTCKTCGPKSEGTPVNVQKSLLGASRGGLRCRNASTKHMHAASSHKRSLLDA